ncbi:MAG: ABC transporter ATP-binding protein [Clostridia bacterium]|nr:ABC transporter ATP-binding protein [Clostridia bacterium]
MKKKRINEAEALQLKNGLQMIKEFFRKNYMKYIGGLLAIIAVDLCSIYTPILSGSIVDQIVNTVNGIDSLTARRLLLLCSLIVFVALFRLVGNYLTRFFVLGASYVLDYAVRNKLFNKLLSLSMNYYNKRSTGEIMALSSNDLNAVTRAVGMGIMQILNTIFLFSFSVVYLITKLNVGLTIAVFIPFPFLLLIIIQFGKIIHKRFQRVQESYAEMTGKVEETISGIRVVKSFVQEDNEINNFMAFNNKNYEANVSLAKLQAIFNPTLSLLSNITYFILLIFGGIMAMDGKITLGDFIIINGFLGMLVRPITFIGMIINFVQQGKVSITRLSELIYQKADIYDGKFKETHEESELPERLKGNISIKNLNFKYQEKETYSLKNISIELKSGETLGIVGEIGSGKTTLVNLLMRVFDFEETDGSITIDGYDIKQMPLKYLRNNIGYVPQDNFLFSDTIAYNISFSEKGHTDEEIMEAAKKSSVYNDIMEFEEGFDTFLGEKGVNISGGQKQRLCISRALIQDRPIMIFDDCLSAVDVETEKEILHNLRDERDGRTSIVIAHRISTIKDSDMIIVLDNGEIAERGTHDELMDLKGEYYKMYKLQLMEDYEGGNDR